jgi:hypothetical protein
MTAVLVLWVLCAGVAALVGNSKGRSAGAFALAGLFFGVFGVVYAACARSGEQLAADRADRAGRPRRRKPLIMGW